MKTITQKVSWIALAFCWGACASMQPVQSEASNPDTPPILADILRARLKHVADEPVHVVRYNPTSCRCPPFEILLSDHWHRVDLEVSDVDNPTLAELLRLTSDSRRNEALKRYRLAGTLEGKFGECGRGLPMLTFRPSEFKGLDAPPPEAPTDPTPDPPLKEPSSDGSLQKESFWKHTSMSPCS